MWWGLWEPADGPVHYCSLAVLSAQSGWNPASLAQSLRSWPEGKHNLLYLVEKGQAGLGSNPSTVTE